jgi:hypothetical protein
LKNATLIGITKRKIIVVPCIVKSWLKASGETNVLPGVASWIRIISASRPPSRKKANAVLP